ncbi:MAG: hypothetical protein ACKJSG_16745 [Lentisphaeria bacterium]
MPHPITSQPYRFEDPCNIYVLTDGDWALLIDCGDSDVCSVIGELGVRQIDRALFAYYHRDQCFGAADFAATGAGPMAFQARRVLQDSLRRVQLPVVAPEFKAIRNAECPWHGRTTGKIREPGPIGRV